MGKFRDRVHTVWFTNEIPVSFGPWKLNGLPCIIIGSPS
jgi:GLPGLI family protein